MLHFYVKVELTHNKIVRIRELNNREYGVYLKTIMENDGEDVNTVTDDIIKLVLKDPKDFETLSYLDKLILLLVLRTISIGSYISKVDTFDGNEKELPILEIVNEILDKCRGLAVQYTIDMGPLKLFMSIPRGLRFYPEMDESGDALNYIQIGDIRAEYNTLSKEDKESIENSMGQEHFQNIYRAVHKFDSDVLGTIKIQSLADFFNVQEFTLSYFTGEMSSFIIGIFNHDYNEYMKRQFEFINKIGSTYEHFQAITMSDVQAFIVKYNESIQEAQAAQKEKS